jgi:signal recognition particle GTPase
MSKKLNSEYYDIINELSIIGQKLNAMINQALEESLIQKDASERLADAMIDALENIGAARAEANQLFLD